MTTTVIVLVVVLLLVAALRLWLTANRLDRLHVRTEAAWVALEGALSRRVVAARAMAAAGGLAAGTGGAAARRWPGGRRRRPRRTGPTPRTICPGRWPRCRPTSRRIWPASWPTPANGWCWPAGSTTTRCGTPGRCGRSGSPGSSGWPAGPARRSTSRSPSTSGRPGHAAGCPGGAVRCPRTGCCCSSASTRRTDEGGGSPPAAASRRTRTCGQAAIRELAEETGLLLDAADLPVRCGGAPLRSPGPGPTWSRPSTSSPPGTAGFAGGHQRVQRAGTRHRARPPMVVAADLAATADQVYPVELRPAGRGDRAAVHASGGASPSRSPDRAAVQI